MLGRFGKVGTCYSELGMHKRGYSKLLEAKSIANRLNLMQHKAQVYKNLASYFENIGELDSSIVYLQLSKIVFDSIYTQNLNEKLTELTVKFETEKKELEIKNLSQQNEIQELELQKSKTAQYWTIAGFIIALVVLALVFIQFRTNQKRKLAEVVVAEQQRGIDAVIQAEENERKRIASDLHDGIGQQLSGLKLFFSRLKSELNVNNQKTSKDLIDFEQVLDNACTDVRSISHQMMPKTLLEKGLVESIQGMLETSLGLNKMIYNFEHFNLKPRYNERVEISIYRICQELVNNIIKHSNATEVVVQLYSGKAHLILHVEDNGVGFNMNGTKDGIGQLNMSSRINNLNGKFAYESEPGKGTSATIKIPLSNG
jgi:signal transduction histidine kinase